LNPPLGRAIDAGRPRYRFGFVLSTTIGNHTRYVNLRKYASRDLDVVCSWTPVTHVASARPSRAQRLLPQALALRLWILQQMWPALRGLGQLDVVMVHLFEAEVACVARSYFLRRPALISSTDEAPVIDQASYPLYPHQQGKPAWRHALRLWLDRWRASRIDAFIPFTAWGGRMLAEACDVAGERIFPIHVGLDLELWRLPSPEERMERAPPRLLFVGADFERKGGQLLLEVFAQRFSTSAELHIVSPQTPHAPARGVHVYRDMRPNDPRLVDLYATCDVLVLPTEADLVPWVLLEAMAMQLPIVSTNVGAIPEIVEHDSTGLIVPVRDAAALAAAIERLLNDPELRRAMGRRGRERVERDFDAALNVPRILGVMKSVADRARAGAGVPPAR
jgi:glycosyltransferase involved in cell wall biosynthesis